MDATRISDGQLVYIKRIPTGSEEGRIATMLVGDSLKNDARNHCVPVLDLFQDDEDETLSYMVMPFLRDLIGTPFETVDDVVDFVDQILEVRCKTSPPRSMLNHVQGLVFIHEQGVAHRSVFYKCQNSLDSIYATGTALTRICS